MASRPGEAAPPRACRGDGAPSPLSRDGQMASRPVSASPARAWSHGRRASPLLPLPNANGDASASPSHRSSTTCGARPGAKLRGGGRTPGAPPPGGRAEQGRVGWGAGSGPGPVPRAARSPRAKDEGRRTGAAEFLTELRSGGSGFREDRDFPAGVSQPGGPGMRQEARASTPSSRGGGSPESAPSSRLRPFA